MGMRGELTKGWDLPAHIKLDVLSTLFAVVSHAFFLLCGVGHTQIKGELHLSKSEWMTRLYSESRCS
jgi:hypothetical protein